MKVSGLAVGLALVSLLPASAQVTVEVTLEQEQFLAGEALPVAVRITNLSGQTLRFGNRPDWLTFSIESRDGFIVVKNSEVPVLGEFTVESSKVATRRVDLGPHFALTRFGRYSVSATVQVAEWGAQLTGKPANFDIIRGARLWSQEFGVPPAAGAPNEPPEVRRYTLQQANYLNSQIRLYLRLTDAPEARVFKVFPIGHMRSVSKPEPQVDKHSNLHVLYQDDARSYSYTVVNPDGDITLRQTYDYVHSRPRLKVDKEGKMSVLGGVRRVTPNDIPRPKLDEDDLLPPTPPSTTNVTPASTTPP
jgi:hypothetical protein